MVVQRSGIRLSFLQGWNVLLCPDPPDGLARPGALEGRHKTAAGKTDKELIGAKRSRVCDKRLVSLRLDKEFKQPRHRYIIFAPQCRIAALEMPRGNKPISRVYDPETILDHRPFLNIGKSDLLHIIAVVLVFEDIT